MEKVILDFDNTMGVKGCDVDDGLTFLYLHGNPKIDVVGVTTTHGNNKQEVVWGKTKEMFDDLKFQTPLFKGSRWARPLESKAVDFLVNTVNEHPGQITVIALGATTNVYGAYLKDNSFFDKVKRLVLMGGITEKLYINGALCKELNFSIDYEATYYTLKYGKNISILSSQTTLQAKFREAEYQRVKAMNNGLSKYLLPTLDYWLELNNEWYGLGREFYNWDVVTAIYVTNPEIFSTESVDVIIDMENFKHGLLLSDAKPQDETKNIDIPTNIDDLDQFNELFFEALANISID
jgi:inosine-uridine nucleoside N-ribohydrolase